ncbi:MAG: hypothetical protein WCX71_03505 [Candidatus Buchananbacteria bacterium]
MVISANNNSDDFFSLLEKEQKEESQQLADEIIFLDEAGQMKVLKNGQVFDFEKKTAKENKPAAKIKIKAAKPQTKNDSATISSAAAPPIKPNSNQPVKKENNNADSISSEIKIPAAPFFPPDFFLQKPVSAAAVASQATYQSVAEEIIAQTLGKKSADLDLLKRLKNIIISHLKNIRDRVEAKEMLMAPVNGGGAGLNYELAAKILDLASYKRAEFLQEKLPEVPKMTMDLQTQTSQAPIRSLTKPLAIAPVVAPAKLKPKVNPAPRKNSVSVLAESVNNSAPSITELVKKSKVEPSRPEKFTRTEKNKLPPKKSEPYAVSPVKKNEPVFFKPQLLGPVEEIKTMNLTDFRRLNSDPQKATEKILEKIELLQDQSLVEKIRGIKAWKESEVYQMYLSLGNQAMAEKKTIAQVISERQSLNQPTLSNEEIEAIIELSQKLRY